MACSTDIAFVSIHAPAWGATWRALRGYRWIRFNPRAPRGARRSELRLSRMCSCFNPRAPRGARPFSWPSGGFADTFQSTRPAWGATKHVAIDRADQRFQSTRPRGARPSLMFWRTLVFGFNPRAPRGARLGIECRPLLSVEFQSTRPAWGATLFQLSRFHCSSMFQSTRPAWGATANICGATTGCEFQSTRPAWGATRPYRVARRLPAVSIHAPRVGRDSRHGDNSLSARVSIHAPRVGRDGRREMLWS